MIKAKLSCFTIILLFVFAIPSFSQESNSKALNKADKLFKVKNYSDALKLYLEGVPEGSGDQLLNYKIGKCYVESEEVNQQIQAVAYFEKVVELDPLPFMFYMDKGDAYFYNEQISQALITYNKQMPLLGRDASMKGKLNQKIKQAENASKYISSPKDVTISRLGPNVNTNFTEYNPVVSADETILAFTLMKPNTDHNRSILKFVEQIYISYNRSGDWSVPELLPVSTDSNYGTAGISADGQKMLIFIGDQKSGSIYSIQKDGEEWTRPAPLGRNINSHYLESTASMTPDGKTLYFASNRSGGYGGMDIYKSELEKDGSWGRPVNLGKEINSRADEDAPFIHPSMNMLFFTSNGHGSMGGNDIFRAINQKGLWLKPENMGYPINTTSNDSYFTLIADGSRGYFSSDRKGGAGGQDIYMMSMPENFESIPLTMIKGQILDAETGEPIPTKIYVIDNETGTKLDFVYHPDKNTGDYLIILPPDKNYDMIIESEGFLPYTLNVDIPNQSYFYELYQKILLKTIKHFDIVVGQEVEVKNAFYDSHEDEVASMRKEHEAALIDSDSIDVFTLMGDLIEAGDSEGMDYLISLILMSNPIDDVDFNEETNDKIQTAKRTYYYDESDESKFEKKNIDGETILSLPTMFVAKEAEEQQDNDQAELVKIDPKLLSASLKVYFSVGKSELDQKYNEQLDEILAVLKKNPSLGVEISGYASPEGDEEYNHQLSNNRAISVVDYLNHRGIVRRRIVAKGLGETSSENLSNEELRRVDVNIVEQE